VEFIPSITFLLNKRVTFPAKYLGLPLHFNKLRRENLQPLVDSFLSRMAGRRGNCYPLKPKKKKKLLQTVLSSIPIYNGVFLKISQVGFRSY
jgi:hypothetical protein